MFEFFDNKSKNDQTDIAVKEMQETKARFFVFIEKLEEKMSTFAEASVLELNVLSKEDPDEFKRGYHRMKSAVLGQLASIQKKALDVKEEKIDGFVLPDGSHETSAAYRHFRSECYERYNQLEELHSQCREQIENTNAEDFEVKYQRILDEYEAIKDAFRCVQCGSPITIEKLYFTTTYITCPACQTRNTFEPSSQAKMLEHISRSLAEQRTAYLLKEHDAIPEEAQDLYLEAHHLELSLIHEQDKNVVAQKRQEIQRLQKRKENLESKRPALYQTYLRAMFDEWNKLNPALAEEHEKFYIRLLNDYQQYKY